jgi:hypothetical protein
LTLRKSDNASNMLAWFNKVPIIFEIGLIASIELSEELKIANRFRRGHRIFNIANSKKLQITPHLSDYLSSSSDSLKR